MSVPARPTPEQLLIRVQAEAEYNSRGRLKVFLGYASGVGKSFRMLDEGRRRHERGQDVVVGAIQPQPSPHLDQILRPLEVIPLRAEGTMDMERILHRHPQVCLVDGLAYDNPPGSTRSHRWQDVDLLLATGISVLTTINLQFVAELQPQVESIRGKSVVVSVPRAFLQRADEIVLVDAPAEFCTEPERTAGIGASHTDQQRKLSQLREIALLLAADVVDEQLELYLKRQGIFQTWGMQERILVCLSPKTDATRMLERARLTRERFHGALFVVHVKQPGIAAGDRIAFERNLSIARETGAEIALLDGDDEVASIMQYARKQGITQIFVGHSLTDSWHARFSRTTTDRLIRAAEGIDVRLFPH